MIAVFSFLMAKQQGARPYKVVAEHLAITILVIAIAHGVGDWIATLG